MIKEAINFIDNYKSQTSSMSDKNIDNIIEFIKNKYPFICVVNLTEMKDQVCYKDFTLLQFKKNEILKETSVEAPEQWLRNHRYLIENLFFDEFISPMSEYRKRIGSVNGIGTFSLFHFNIGGLFNSKGLFIPKNRIISHKLSSKDYENTINSPRLNTTEKKCIECLNNEENTSNIFYNEKKPISQMSSIVFDFLAAFMDKINIEPDLFEPTKNEKKLKKAKKYNKLLRDVYVFIEPKSKHLPRKALNARLENILFLSDDTVEENGQCPICIDNNVKIGFPTSYNTLGSEKKPFNVHYDRSKLLNVLICINCLKKLNDFEKFMDKNEIKFFPLFINESLQIDLIKSLRDNKKSFFEILEHIRDLNKEKEVSYDFYLIHRSNDILFYDYISNYKMNFGKYNYYYSKNKRKPRKYGAKDFLGSLYHILRFSYGHYFGNLSRMDTTRKYLILKYRNKFFDTIYRNKRNLASKEIAEIVVNRLDNQIVNSSLPKKEEIWKTYLDFYLNSCIFSKTNDAFLIRNKKGGIMLDTIRSEKNEIIKGNSLKIDSDSKFGYYLGQLIYYLIQKSQTDNKMALLTPILSCQSIKTLRRVVIEKYLEKYARELSNYKDFRHIVIAETLDYLNTKLKTTFNTLKIAFYIGYFDENIFYSKREDKNE